jgi:hypothetical protein
MFLCFLKFIKFKIQLGSHISVGYFNLLCLLINDIISNVFHFIHLLFMRLDASL